MHPVVVRRSILTSKKSIVRKPPNDDEQVHITAVGQSLPPAITGSRSDLPSDVLAELRALCKPDPVRFLLVLAFAWFTIAVAISLATYADNIFVTIAVVFFIGTRQNILGLLMHEQCHRLAFRSKKGDLIANFFACYPLFLTLEDYRRIHLAHHHKYFTSGDPDFRRKQGKEWTFPQKCRYLLRSFFLDITGIGFIRMIRGKTAASAKKSKTGFSSILRLSYYLTFAILFTVTGTWTQFLLFWFLPLITVMQVIVRWGAICEHKYNLINPSIPESTPIIIPRWWEALMLPNLNFTFHVHHHWFPQIPFSKLPIAHRILEQAGRVNIGNVFRGYGDYFRFITGIVKK